MKRRSKLAWRMSAVVVIAVLVILLGTGFLGSYIGRRAANEVAYDVLQFNSTSIRSGIQEMMMSRNNSGVREYIEDIAGWSPTYCEICLVSHPDGLVAVSRLMEPGTIMAREDRTCAQCHADDSLPTASLDQHQQILPGVDGGRVLQVVTPILNEPGCRTAGCHAHLNSGPLLGFLHTEYSLADIDRQIAELNGLLALAAVLGMVLGIGGLLIAFRRLLVAPLRSLVDGIGALGAGHLDYRFDSRRDDEIGLVQESFNSMATKLQAHQTELRRTLKYLEGIVENSADLIITVNPAGQIETFNRGAEQALGFRRDEVIGLPMETLFADPQERAKAISRLAGQGYVANIETRFKTSDGAERHVLLTLSRLRDQEGRAIGTLGISKDVTTERELQQQLFESEQAVAIGRAVTAIQHAIKNMLNTLRGGLYIVQVGLKRDRRDRIREGCEMIEDGFQRISDLSRKMLKYARNWQIETEPTDLNAMVNETAGAIRQVAAENGVALRVELDPDLPTIHCDPGLIHMTFMDLLTNALDACDMKEYKEGETPEIVCRTACGQGCQVLVEIQDNGVGMTEEVRKNVLTPFFSTKKKWGTGLGLALTSRIIRLHAGEIIILSKPDRGALFRVILPLSHPNSRSGT
ncbi:PAS domain S-box protein [bacterium]|nr:PAS domain S-box protein [bacterium]MBU1073170.1 PAS domain S-box protein [bacterium]MBU1675418.1 PAS domain S-box protein [bacterium]